ncbi:MAG TPA: hypothetical protein VGS20_12410 [Candidatus Acidoferrales bacterium]|nr:hypothetical protein [Candidatus Acidoferrales bacterium]
MKGWDWKWSRSLTLAARTGTAGALAASAAGAALKGRPGADRTSIGLVFARKPPAQRIITLQLTNDSFLIPPGVPASENKWQYFVRPRRQ